IKLGGRSESKTVTMPYEAGLFMDLKALRSRLAAQENVPPYLIFSDSTLLELATYLPQEKQEIQRISGFGEIKTEKYAGEFLPVRGAYCRQYGLPSRINNKKPKRQRQEPREKTTDTKLMSLRLYKQGMPVQEIAEKRNLSPQTIEGHLTHFILEGSIDV